MTERLPPRGLYAVTDDRPAPDADLVRAVEAAILGGARLIQYRDKSADPARRHRQAGLLSELCRRHGVPLIVNDDVELAAASGAAGVHLGEDDPAPEAARARLGPDAIIGVSCYDRLDLALAARGRGADYVAFGSVYPSSTKPAARRAGLELLREARRRLDLPIAAIGGITPANAPPLVAAGVDWLAVISGVFGQPDVAAAARAYAALFDPTSPPTTGTRS